MQNKYSGDNRGNAPTSLYFPLLPEKRLYQIKERNLIETTTTTTQFPTKRQPVNWGPTR